MKTLSLFAFVFLVGCGSVTVIDDDSDAAGDTLGAKPDVQPEAPAVEVKPEVASDTKPEVPPGRPLGAGCTEDAQCSSDICVSGACCNGRPGECSACVGGYVTPKPDGATACGACRAGALVDVAMDGTSCGESCGGPLGPGFDGMPKVPTVATKSTCRAGSCVAAPVDCLAKSCPAGCAKRYIGCFLDTEDAPGAVCRCVDTSGNFCSSSSPGRPLGAGCTEDMQCGSQVCYLAPDVAGVCCDARPTEACSPCVGGYITPLKDGSVCGPGEGPPWECRAGRCKLKN